MTDLDQPLTRREFLDFRADLEVRLQTLATKDELQTVREELAGGFAEMRSYLEISVKTVRNELRTHFDTVAESFRTDFRNLYDWTRSTASSLATRVESLELGHGARLSSLETRVTRLETNDTLGTRRRK